MAEWLIPLFRDAYPDITFVTHEQVEPQRYYATYNRSACSSTTTTRLHQPCDFRLVGLHRTAGYILGVDPTEEPPRLVPSAPDRPIAEPYVCIAVQSTTQAKYWNNPYGWREVVALPEGRRLPGDLHRPATDARQRPRLEPHSARRARTRPATGR